ncbi:MULTISPECIES: efflux transporter outer membrane subunit [unclassified Saccharibacter]|uniref:efflux transporter outer membrane subunit n=1 Tax=unclassified Saccharibacter TaxID=2648722 RepID=UPI00132582E4|nr:MULTISPECIES: efflux transporter outer membrane subunit [unclassified Saccharibacter]MXV36748.1 efflux transporter outer membrane subunit [Saccharibacter sp. EH611]MXV58240.1 efflux transporter outer membrane subunit [Saccharibacter sp. EH70]MXV65696.1 efflux transporter outer membrane subunit [Saccharibacter sp. EH60]
MRRFVTGLGLSSLLLASACNMSPTYHRPSSEVSAAYPKDSYASGKAAPRPASDLGWEDFFTDPRLKKLIELTLDNNRDLAAQLATVVDQRGQYQVQNAALFPTIGVGGAAQYVAPSKTAGFSFAPGSGRNISTLRFYQTSIGFSSYEIDLWQRVRNLSRTQKEQTLNAVSNLRNLWITTVSQVAETYIQWLSDRQLLALAQRTYETRQRTWALTKLSYDHHQVDALTLAQVSAQRDEAEADIARLTRAVADDAHGIQLLVGKPLPNDLPPPAPMGAQTMMTDLPEGLPFDLLAQRPDIEAAEHTLKGANASIGSARAAFMPRITLTANEGTSALMFRKVFTSMAETWGVSPNISIPLLTWGQNQGNLRSAHAQLAKAAAQYQKAIQNAFREVADALTARETYRDQEASMRRYVAEAQQAYDLAQMRYHAGIDSYLTTLEQERQLYAAQQSHIVVQAARFQNIVTLYRALGGGWTRASVKPSASAGTK